jgi:hypothetical protein
MLEIFVFSQPDEVAVEVFQRNPFQQLAIVTKKFPTSSLSFSLYGCTVLWTLAAFSVS